MGMSQIRTDGIPSESFIELVNSLSDIGKKRHTEKIILHATENRSFIERSTREIPIPEGDKKKSALIISAGPSLHRREHLESLKRANYSGSIVAVDAAYIALIRRGIIPDYVLTLDPHPTRMVRWFGDHEWEKHSAADDYFQRQDLNIEFRKNSIIQNSENIELVNTYGHKTKAIVASSIPKNVRERLREANFQLYWWNPLVDDPASSDSLTRQLYSINKLPCMNTGGNVGTASWVFASSILGISQIGAVGMDLGYYLDTPLELTQTYYELANKLGTDQGIEQYFSYFTFPLNGEEFYTDPTYFWYRRNFLNLVSLSKNKTYNCTEGGTLFGENITCMNLNDFFKMQEA
jgi:hypothetical protein